MPACLMATVDCFSFTLSSLGARYFMPSLKQTWSAPAN